MSDSEAFPCPRCGSLYQLTPEYVAQFGGQTTQCARCGSAFVIPTQIAPSAPQPALGNTVSVLPYAGPAVLSGLAGVWREGKMLVASKGVTLPDRCAKCNAPAGGPPIRRKYMWHHPAIYLILLVQIIVYIIVALIVREQGIVYISLCQRHRRRRTILVIGGWIAALGGIGAVVGGFALALGNRPPDWAPLIILLGFVMLIAGVAFGSSAARILGAKRIDKQFLWLRGANPAFLADLPDVRAPYEAPASPTATAQLSQ